MVGIDHSQPHHYSLTGRKHGNRSLQYSNSFKKKRGHFLCHVRVKVSLQAVVTSKIVKIYISRYLMISVAYVGKGVPDDRTVVSSPVDRTNLTGCEHAPRLSVVIAAIL